MVQFVQSTVRLSHCPCDSASAKPDCRIVDSEAKYVVQSYTGLCRYCDRVESAYSAVRVNWLIVLAGDKFRLIKGIKTVCGSFLIANWSYLFVNTWTPKWNSNALLTWSRWTFAIAVNIGNDSNLAELLFRRSISWLKWYLKAFNYCDLNLYYCIFFR